MSYCRCSSEGFTCDVYVYESVAGFITHVGKNRITERAPDIWPEGDASPEEMQACLDKHRAHMANAKFEPIGLPCDGETYNDETAGECAERLTLLQSLGYNVPDYAIDALLEETNAKD